MIELTVKAGVATFAVRVSPGAAKTRILGEHDGALKISVAAAPEKGKANKAVVDYVARLFAVRKADVEVISGLSSKDKRVAIKGLAPGAISDKLSALLK